MQHRHLNGLVVGAVFIVAAGCVQDSVRSAPRPHAMAAAENAYPAVPSSSPKPWKRFALEQGMGQPVQPGRSEALPVGARCCLPTNASALRRVRWLRSFCRFHRLIWGCPETRMEALKHAAYVASPGLGARADFTLATNTFWARSFESREPSNTVYLVGG